MATNLPLIPPDGLTQEQVIEIVDMFWNQKQKCKVIAEKFKIPVHTIMRIKGKYKSWMPSNSLKTQVQAMIAQDMNTKQIAEKLGKDLAYINSLV